MNREVQHTALITGASMGLGLALARELARQGWHLIIDARHEDALEAARAELAKLTTVTAIAGDVSERPHCEALAQAAHDAGGLDTLVNNASTLGPLPRPNLLDFPVDGLVDVFLVNVIAPLGLIQAVRDDLKPNARIINVTSDAGVEPYAGWGGYGSSKAALEHLSAILAQEMAKELPSMRVYWVDPGDMQTQMQRDAFPGEDISDRGLPEDNVPGLVELLNGDYASGRYSAKAISGKAVGP